MKAILEGDIPIKLSLRGTGTEVPPLPSGVSLKHLRFNGTDWVDLADPAVTEMWIRRVNGVWSLHATELPGAQLVQMTWQERRHLVEDPPGTYRVLSKPEWDQRQADEQADRQDNRSLKAQLIDLIKSTSFADLETRVNNIFGDHTGAQKKFLLQLSRIVLYLAKKEVK